MLANDAGDRRNLQPLGVKHGALLNVDLEKSNGIFMRRCCRKPIRIKSECANRFFERKTLNIFESQQRRIKTPGNRAASQEWHAKTYSLFF